MLFFGGITDEGVVPAVFLHSGRPVHHSPSKIMEPTEVLTCDLEEADDCIMMHCAWEVDRRSSRPAGSFQ